MRLALRDSVQWQAAAEDAAGAVVYTNIGEAVPCEVRPKRFEESAAYGTGRLRIATHEIRQRTIHGLTPGVTRALIEESNGRTFTAEVVAVRTIDRYREWQEVDARETGPAASTS